MSSPRGSWAETDRHEAAELSRREAAHVTLQPHASVRPPGRGLGDPVLFSHWLGQKHPLPWQLQETPKPPRPSFCLADDTPIRTWFPKENLFSFQTATTTMQA